MTCFSGVFMLWRSMLVFGHASEMSMLILDICWQSIMTHALALIA